MKVGIKVRDSAAQEWHEDYDRPEIEDGDIQSATDWAGQLIEGFNQNLRPGELRRELVCVERLGASTDHTWYKRTDGMSARIGGRIVDVMECSKCGVTGKKAGLSSVIKRDSKYRAKKFAVCLMKV